MQNSYWHKQSPHEPLFPDLIWSRPEHKATAGKLGIVGGNVQGFAAAAEAYSEAINAGVGTCRVLLPDSLQKTVGRIFEAGEYAPSTPSGSFSQQSLSSMLELAMWSDGILIAGDLAHSSETAIVLEKLVYSYNHHLTLTKDAADYFTAAPQKLLERPDTLLVISFAQMQKLATRAHFPHAFTFDMDLLRLIDYLHEFTQMYTPNIIVKHLDNIIVATKGQVSTTKLAEDLPSWRVKTAAHACVWWLQNPTKTFQALSTSIVNT